MYEDYFKKMKDECLLRNRTEGTYRTYENHVLKFIEWTGKEPKELTIEDARNYIFETRVEKKMSTQHCNCINSALKFFYRHVLHIPWDQDAVPRMVNDVRLPRVLPLEDVEKMIETATEVRNKAIIALMYSSGLRLSEICRLAPEDIYMSTMQVHIRSGKNHCDHWTILSQRTLDLLTEYWKTFPRKRDVLFVGLKYPYAPLKPSGVEIMVRKVGNAAGIEHMHPHILRHSFASHMIEQGVSLENIQAMMGHRNPDSTHQYIHVSNKSLMGIKSPLDHPAPKKRGRKRRMNSDTTIQDVFERFLPEYAEVSNFSERQHLVVDCIRKCRTAEMGAHVSECDSCHNTYIHYNSCKNRHCPMCQGMDVDVWIDKQQENVLNTPYFHTVFTIPEELYSLVYSNQKLLYDALYHAANKTLTELSSDPKYLGAQIGYICVLHTWGSRMNYHPHLHTIVLGGGLDKKNHWTDKNGKMFFPVKVMSAVFKKHYLNELKALWETNQFEYHGSSEHLKNHYEFKALLDKLYSKEWIVYTKQAFNGAKSVINYLGRYTHRIAISNRRIESIEGDDVIYKAKDYANGGKMVPISAKGTAFIQMFLMHVLPKGFVRIRHYGLLSCRNKKDKMTLCRNLLGCEKYISKLRDKTVAEKIYILYKHDICKCKYCGEPVHSYVVPGRYMLC